MKPTCDFDIEQILEDAEKLVKTIIESNLIIELTEDHVLIFTRIRRAAENLLMTEDQFNQAGSIVDRVLKFKDDSQITLANTQEEVIRDTLEKIQLNRGRLHETLSN
jgi:hypothetical protein